MEPWQRMVVVRSNGALVSKRLPHRQARNASRGRTEPMVLGESMAAVINILDDGRLLERGRRRLRGDNMAAPRTLS